MTTLVAALDPSAFDPLVQELTRERVAVNYDRHQAGKGRSQAFGIIRRWSYRPHLARNTWGRPRLWQLILDFAAEHVPIPWDGCTVNDCYESREHTDKGNQGQSYTVSFGNFTEDCWPSEGKGGPLPRLTHVTPDICLMVPNMSIGPHHSRASGFVWSFIPSFGRPSFCPGTRSPAKNSPMVF